MIISMIIMLPTMIANIIFLLFPLMMFCHNVYLVCINQTSYESYKQSQLKRNDERFTFDEGCWTNWTKFLQQHKTQQFLIWKPVSVSKNNQNDICCDLCCECTCCDTCCRRTEQCCDAMCDGDGCCVSSNNTIIML
jgi:uncharacterized membrane protein YdbT with pleckstrin-like domain